VLERTIECNVGSFIHINIILRYGIFNDGIQRISAIMLKRNGGRRWGYTNEFRGWIYRLNKQNIYSITLNEFNSRQRRKIKKCKAVIDKVKHNTCDACVHLNNHILKGRCNETYEQM